MRGGRRRDADKEALLTSGPANHAAHLISGGDPVEVYKFNVNCKTHLFQCFGVKLARAYLVFQAQRRRVFVLFDVCFSVTSDSAKPRFSRWKVIYTQLPQKHTREERSLCFSPHKYATRECTYDERVRWPRADVIFAVFITLCNCVWAAYLFMWLFFVIKANLLRDEGRDAFPHGDNKIHQTFKLKIITSYTEKTARLILMGTLWIQLYNTGINQRRRHIVITLNI